MKNITVRKCYFYTVKVFKRIFDFIIESSLWVALSVASLTYITFVELSLKPDVNILLLVFSSTVFGYNFVKFFEKGQLREISLLAIKKQFIILTSKMKVNLLLSLTCLLISIYSFLQLKFNTQLFLMLPAVLTYFYTNPLNVKTLRSISGLKIFIIAICWVLVVLGLPVFELNLDFTTDVYIKSVQIFLFIISITLPFEIRDLLTDPYSLGTIPQKIGVRNTKLLALILLMSFLLLEFFKDEVREENLQVLPLVFVISLLAVLLSKEKQSKYYASFWVESIPVLWFLLILFI